MRKKAVKEGDRSLKFKQEAVERMRSGENISGLSRELKVSRKVLYGWKRSAERGDPLRRRGRPPKAPPDAESMQLTASRRIEELEAVIGRLTVENRFFKGALQRIKDLRRSSGGSGGKAFAPRSKS